MVQVATIVHSRLRSGSLVLALIVTACGSSPPAAVPSALDSTTALSAQDADQKVDGETAGAETAGGGSDDGSESSDNDVAPSPAPSVGSPNANFTPILVDQFGYLPSARKVAVLVDPGRGPTEDLAYTPGAELQVVDVDSGQAVFAGAPEPWNDGAEDPQSGDRGWRFDFSTVTQPGSYRIDDSETGWSSAEFVVSDDAYRLLLETAQRVFYFNRANVAHDESLAGAWSGPAAVVGDGQDTEALSIDDSNAPRRDLSGGWFDAGDTNKYVTFATSPVHQLLAAFETAPELFGDDAGVPESDNGISDLLDEVRVELEWLVRMQSDDGGVLTKVGFSGYDGPANIYDDTRPRFFEEACSSSSIAAAGMFAHGAVAFETIDPEFAADLADRAVRAFDWFEANPRRDDCDPQVINAGDADVAIDQQGPLRFVASVYLFAVTGDDRFDRIAADEFDGRRVFPDATFGRYNPERAEAIEFYLRLDGADPNLKEAMRVVANEMNRNVGAHGYDDSAGLYRSYMPDGQYHWGSNMVMANSGNGSLALARLGIEPDQNIERASAHLNTINGINPLGIVYLSNMNSLGAERSINEIYHFWFADGSDYDHAWNSPIGPAPGYVVGGPNASYSGSADVPRSPISKAYGDFNSKDGDTRPWELSEPAIYYQAAYVRLLSGVIAAHR